MNSRLYQRRYRMLKLIALGSSLPSVISAISQEFECSEKTVYKDYQTMDQWGKKLRQDKQLEYLLYARLDLLNRTATEIMLSAKKYPDKVRAGTLVLKVTQEQKKLETILEAQKAGSHTLKSLSTKMPFEDNPLIKQAYLEEERKQRANATLRAEKDAKGKAEPNSGH
jgi:hypothetical protein